MEGYIEKPELTHVIEGFTFSSEESNSLMILICAFVMIDGDFLPQKISIYFKKRVFKLVKN